MVRIKGADEPVPAHRLLGMANGIALPSVLSRLWSVGGGRCPPSRACWSARSRATARWSAWWDPRVSVRAVWCARSPRWQPPGVSRCSPPSASRTPARVPFHAVARLLRAATGVEGLDAQAARDRLRAQAPDADPEDLLLFDDLLGIADPDAAACPQSIQMPVGGG